MSSQHEFALRAINEDKLALFGDAGVGKTRAGLMARLNWRNRVQLERMSEHEVWDGGFPRIKTLWITKNSARREVLRECQQIGMCAGVRVLDGPSRRRIEEVQNTQKYFFVTNYESILTPLYDQLIRMHWDLIVLDEAHNIKNPTSKTAHKIIQLGEGVRFKLVMTGTPLLNSELDLWAPLFFCDNEAWEEQLVQNAGSTECQTAT
jgi:SNF2 family DNA or RNA helicase